MGQRIHDPFVEEQGFPWNWETSVGLLEMDVQDELILKLF
jgi:hypothetical protein